MRTLIELLQSFWAIFNTCDLERSGASDEELAAYTNFMRRYEQ